MPDDPLPDLARIRRAAERLRGRVFNPPCRPSEWLSDATGRDVRLKLEIVQPTSSYKIRGAFNAALAVREHYGDGAPPLVTASAGNHGRALAYAARALALPLTVYVAQNAPRAKIDAIRACGATLETCADYDAAERDAKMRAGEGRDLFISPYSHPDVIAGAGTIGLELVEHFPELTDVVVPVGGGGLISGIAIALKALAPRVRVTGVEVAASCPFTRSLEAGRIVKIEVGTSLADGLTGNLDSDTITFDLVREFVDRIVVVDEAEVATAMAAVIDHEHVIVEGAAATGLAALASGRTDLAGAHVAVVLTGANVDRDRLVQVLRDAAPSQT
jgi:threonine dehydratase